MCTKGAAVEFARGTLRVYARELTMRDANGVKYRDTWRYACSSKFKKTMRLLPVKKGDFTDDSLVQFAWNGRYLLYVQKFLGATDTYGSAARIVDMKAGRSSVNIKEPAVSLTSWPNCTPAQCIFWAVRSVLGYGASFVVATSAAVAPDHGPFTVPDTFDITLHCINRSFTSHTVKRLDSGLSAREASTLKSHVRSFSWKHGGGTHTAKPCR